MSHEPRPASCIVGHKYYPEHGHLRRDAESLAAAGYEVNVIALRQRGQAAHEIVHGVHVYRLPIEHRRGGWPRYVWEYSLFLILAFLVVTYLHARKRFSVVEVVNMPDVLVFSALVPRITGARVILYIFDNMPELLTLTRGCSPRHPIVRLLAFQERLSAAFAHRVVVTQEVARQVVQARRVPAGKLSVVLNGPDERIFAAESFGNRHRKERRRQDDTLEIVTHGTLLERFGVQTLIDALPKIAAQIPNVRLRVIGEGEYRRELEMRARRLGAAGLVEFIDWVPLDELPAQIGRADIGYVGMLCDNMLSNKLMEYVALGVPVVLARWPVYEHYFSDDAVRYFRAGSSDEVADAVLALHRDPQGAREAARRASALYESYRWKVQRGIYLGIYADLLDARKSGGPSDGAVQHLPFEDPPDGDRNARARA